MIEKTLKAVVTPNEKKGIKEQRECTVTISEPENLQEAMEVDGEQTVFNTYLRQRRIAGQAKMRTMMEKDDWDEATVAEMMASWKPSEGRQVKSKVDKGFDLFKTMSDEEVEAVLARYESERG